MTLDQLRYFVELTYTLHYTQAADKLNISQPSLSYAMNQLSQVLGGPLFVKTGKSVSLSEIGEAFLPYAESALNILRQGEQQIEILLAQSAGNINLGYIYSVSFDVIPKLIDDFYLFRGDRKIHFNLQVNMTDSLLDSLIKGTIDAVVAPYTEAKHDAIESLPLITQELFLMVHKEHPLADRSHVTIDDLRNEKIIMMNKKTNLFMVTDLMFKQNNLIPATEFMVDECNSMAAFVGANLGVAIMPKIPALESFKVVALPFLEDVSRSIHLLWNKSISATPALKSFVEYYRSYT